MIIIALIILGLIFGSFANAVVWRLHRQAELTDKKGSAADAERQKLSITKGRSMCSHCGHALAAKDLIPLFSWLALKGKCRYCHKKIADSPLLEIAMPLAFVVACVVWPFGFTGAGLAQFVVLLGFIVVAVMLAAYDIRWFLLPNRLVYPLIGLGTVSAVVRIYSNPLLTTVLAIVFSTVVLWGVYYALWRISNGKWIGYGDVRLAIGLGLLVGTPLHAFMVIFFSSIIGTLCSLPLIFKKDFKAHIPYGPFLLVATYIVILFGDKLAKLLYV